MTNDFSEDKIAFNLLSVSDSSNNKVISMEIKNLTGLSNPTELIYFILDETTIVVLNKKNYEKNEVFYIKSLSMVMNVWKTLDKNYSNAAFFFQTEEGFFNSISVKDNKSISIELFNVEEDIASAISFYDNFTQRMYKFYYEEETLYSLFENLSSVLDLDISEFNPISKKDMIEPMANSFIESVIGNITKKYKQKKKEKKAQDNQKQEDFIDIEPKEEENKDKPKNKMSVILLLIFLVVVILSISFAGYKYYESVIEEQKALEELDRLAEIKRQQELNKKKQKKQIAIIKKENLSKKIYKMKENEFFSDKLIKIIESENINSIKKENNFIQVNAIIDKTRDINKTFITNYNLIKFGNKYVESRTIKYKDIDLSKMSEKDINSTYQKAINLEDIFNSNFKNYSMRDKNDKAGYIYKDYKKRSELIRDLSSLRRLNTNLFSMNLFQKSHKYNLIIKFK